VIRRFTQSHTKAELMELADRHGLLIGSLESVPEVFASPQLKERGYWRMAEHPELGRAFAYPGPFARFGATPLRYRRRPPTIGEHNREVYVGELGISDERMRELQKSGII
jgi:crotonobetainyl-CoA:carnitine CoA-transferase CaiB-like acyl-CoA transferase